jgi:RND family efflux transporter MFP subunit
LSQAHLPDLRGAVSNETATVLATIPGSRARASGQVAMFENTVDAATGMVVVRALMPNTDELLWPGTLVNVEVTLRTERRITIPATALQTSQAGTFVFVVKDNVASVRPIKVAWTAERRAVIESGLEEGEVVVTDGQLLLSEGTRVNPRGGASS